MIPGLEELGYAVLPSVFEAHEVERAASILEELWPEPRRRRARIALRHLQDRAPVLIDRLRAPLAAIALPILGPEARVVRALAFDKRAEANWSVSWHQDRSVALADDNDHPELAGRSVKEGVPHALAPASWLATMLTLRVHLDDCDEDSGALTMIPGSHREGVLAPEAIRRLSRGARAVARARSGDVLAMRPLILHASSPIAGPGRRRVLHFECAAGPLPAPLRWHHPRLLSGSES